MPTVKNPSNKVKKQPKSQLLWLLAVLVLLFFTVSIGLIAKNSGQSNNNNSQNNNNNNKTDNKSPLDTFESEEAFKNYLVQSDELKASGFGYGMIGMPAVRESFDNMAQAPMFDVGTGGSTGADRYSGTNVQVAGIDEPDVVKTDGKSIFYSDDSVFYPIFLDSTRPMSGSGVSGLRGDIYVDPAIGGQPVAVDLMPQPNYQKPKTKLITAWPVNDLKLDGEINANGELLLSQDNLIVFNNAGRNITAFNVSDHSAPKESWQFDLGDRTYLNTARLYENKVYIVTTTDINSIKPCPYEPFLLNKQGVSIPCNRIYYPSQPSAIDVEFDIVKIDAASGKIEDQLSVVGNAGTSILYMAQDNIYLTYNQSFNYTQLLLDFISEQATDLVPEPLAIKLAKVNAYDISLNSKMVEFESLLGDWLNSLGEDERLKVSTEMQSRLSSFLETNKREYSQTAIVRINVKDLNIAANGSVPGTPLNQFSLDEYDGNLRIATNISATGGGYAFGFATNTKSTNDVYVLNKKLDVIGSIKDLGLDERIYSARFIDAMAYLVTFKQIDPFYVLDLSQPTRPQLKGELKIPGYSSYLHPLKDKKILGVGQENGQLKLSYFDVSDPSNPKEIDKYTINDYSDALYNHHAFLQDESKEIFFIPGGQGAYIFDYSDDSLDLSQAISASGVKRALYLNNYLYIVGSEGITIFDQKDWSRVNDLDF